jgi:cell division control protein 6
MNFEEYFRGSTLFIDESKLFPEYVPPYLPFREEQIKKLAIFFRGILELDNFSFYRAICHGPAGTGKTAVAKFFGKLISDEAKKRGLQLYFIHINCHLERTYFMVVSKIAEHLIPGIPKRGFSPKQYLTWILDYLEEENAKLLLCLDEADYIIRNDPELLYDLTRIPELGINKIRMNLLLILRNISNLYSLDESILSTLQRNINPFNPYSYFEIKEIIKERAQEAFVANAVDNSVIETIAMKSGIDKGGRGDARFALELLWRAGKIAEVENSNKVKIEHLRKAMSEIYPGLSIEVFETLLDEEKLILLSICRALREENNSHVSIKRVREHYELICEKLKRTPRKYTQFWSYIQSLKNKNLINVSVVNEKRGRRSYISIDVPLDTLENKLLEYVKT